MSAALTLNILPYVDDWLTAQEEEALARLRQI